MNTNNLKISAHLKSYFILGSVLLTALVGGCSTAPKQQKIDQAKIQQFATRGYDSGIDYATSSSKLSFNITYECCQLTLVQPNREGKYPLVIYLPGLGESSDAGADMRNAWAKSGYVVLSFQSLKDDENVWSSKAAHSADFAYIRHERYSAEVISERLSILTKVIENLKQRAVSGDASLQRLDLTHIAIVGFDVGASSAMSIAGEESPNVSIVGLSVPVSAVIALSPYADFSGSSLDVRYRNINMPVLSITGDEDGDVHGGVPPSIHQAPFQYMPAGNKYLLLLAGASHSIIGDENSAKSSSNEGDSNNKQTEPGNTNDSSGSERGKRHGKRTSNNGSGSGSSSNRNAGNSPTQRAILEIAIEQVTTAFLNAYVKNDKFSVQWLKQEAQTWLKKNGQLKVK